MIYAVVHWGRTGAGPLLALELTQALTASGEQVVVSYSSNAEIARRFDNLRIPRHSIRTYTDAFGAIVGLFRLPREILRFSHFLRENDVDVVVVAMEHIWQAFASVVFSRRGRASLLCVHDAEMHPGDHSRVGTALRTLERRNADGALTFSSHVAAALRAAGPFKNKLVAETVLAAFPTEGVIPIPRVLPTDRPPIIGFFGRLSAYKGLDLGYEAIQLLRAQGRRVIFRAVGSGRSNALDAMRDVDDQVENRWTTQEEVPEVIVGFDIVLLPYVEASQSGVLAYSMALGVPGVVTPVGGLEEQAIRSGSAVVASATSSAAIAHAVSELLDNPERYAAISCAAIDAANGPYAWSRVVDDIRDASKNLLGFEGLDPAEV